MAQELKWLNEISLPVLGAQLRAHRKKNGYPRAEDLALAMEEKAKYPCSKDYIYRVESGRQEPSLTFLCAFSITVFKRVFAYDLLSMIKASACSEWQSVEDRDIRENAGVYELEAF